MENLVEATWDEALDLVASKLTEMKEANAEQLAFLSSARCTNEDNYVIPEVCANRDRNTTT